VIILDYFSCDSEDVFCRMPYEVDEKCKNNYFYRTLDGSCNWMKKGESDWGKAGTALGRDTSAKYEDGISKPRSGPNPRELSNAFFKSKKILPFNHTPFLTAIVQFIMHDVALSLYDKDSFDIEVPKCDDFFDSKCYGNVTLPLRKTTAVPGTGTSKENPKEQINGATSWLDLSPLYGTNEEVARKLRSFVGGKLKTYKHKGEEFMPLDIDLNSIKWGDKATFSAGDPRASQNYLLLAVHTLFLREHNRVCDLIVERYPQWDDERIYQTARVVMAQKNSINRTCIHEIILYSRYALAN